MGVYDFNNLGEQFGNWSSLAISSLSNLGGSSGTSNYIIDKINMIAQEILNKPSLIASILVGIGSGLLLSAYVIFPTIDHCLQAALDRIKKKDQAPNDNLVEPTTSTMSRKTLFETIEKGHLCGRWDLISPVISAIIDQMDDKGQFEDISANELFEKIETTSEVYFTFYAMIEKSFPDYPFISPSRLNDPKHKLVYSLLRQHDSQLRSFQASYAHDKFLKMNHEERSISLQFLKDNDPALLNVLFVNTNGSSILWKAIDKSFNIKELIDLMDMLKSASPEEFKKMTKFCKDGETPFAQLMKAAGEEFTDVIIEKYSNDFPEFDFLKKEESSSSSKVLSKQEMLLAAVGGNKDLLKTDKDVLFYASQVAGSNPERFLEGNPRLSNHLTNLWNSDRELAKKILSQPVNYQVH